MATTDTSTEERFRPFWCGTQYADWYTSNCEHCNRHTEDASTTCDIDRALLEAMFDDGSVSLDIYRRMGGERWARTRDGKFRLIWPCEELIGDDDVNEAATAWRNRERDKYGSWLDRAAEDR